MANACTLVNACTLTKACSLVYAWTLVIARTLVIHAWTLVTAGTLLIARTLLSAWTLVMASTLLNAWARFVAGTRVIAWTRLNAVNIVVAGTPVIACTLLTAWTRVVAGTLITAHALSRSSAVVVIVTSDYVRDTGTAKPVSMGLNGHGKIIMLTSSAVLVLTGVWVMGFTPMLVGVAVMAVMHFFIRHLFEAKLGGYTGDCLGATQQMSEVGFYLGVAACI